MNEEDRLLKVLEIETNRINHLDTILFNIKVWTTTLVIVLIGFVVRSSSKSESTPVAETELLVLAIAATGLFAFIDVYFRRIQLRNVRNTVEIRRHLKSISESAKVAGMWKDLWKEELPEKGAFRRLMIDYGYTCAVYGSLLVILIYLL